VMVITARRKKGRLPAHALRDLEAKPITPEVQRTFEISDLEMRMANANRRING